MRRGNRTQSPVRDAAGDVHRAHVAISRQHGAGSHFEEAVALAEDGAEDRLLVLAAKDRLLHALMCAGVEFVLDLGARPVDGVVPRERELGIALALVGERRRASHRTVRGGRASSAHRNTVPRQLGEEGLFIRICDERADQSELLEDSMRYTLDGDAHIPATGPNFFVLRNAMRLS